MTPACATIPTWDGRRRPSSARAKRSSALTSMTTWSQAKIQTLLGIRWADPWPPQFFWQMLLCVCLAFIFSSCLILLKRVSVSIILKLRHILKGFVASFLHCFFQCLSWLFTIKIFAGNMSLDTCPTDHLYNRWSLRNRINKHRQKRGAAPPKQIVSKIIFDEKRIAHHLPSVGALTCLSQVSYILQTAAGPAEGLRLE